MTGAHFELDLFTLFVVALGTAAVIRVLAGPSARARSVLVGLALGLCTAGAIATAAVLVCFASGTSMAVQEKLATAALLMGMVGGVLYASVWRAGGDGPSPPDDYPRGPDDPGGDHAYPWWPEFERQLRDYERGRAVRTPAGRLG